MRARNCGPAIERIRGNYRDGFVCKFVDGTFAVSQDALDWQPALRLTKEQRALINSPGEAINEPQ